MSALAHFIESEGIATTGISLVREHTEAMQPPRALWVPFPLGRPLGAVGDAVFQRRVMDAALALLSHCAGPVLRDFPLDAPDQNLTSLAAETWSCPVSFPTAAAQGLAQAVSAELAQLAPWYQLGLTRRGRTALACDSNQLANDLALVNRCCEGHETRWDPDGPTFRGAIENLKVYYQEAVTARPGQVLDPNAIANWLWNETALGQLLRALAQQGARSSNEAVRHVSQDTLVPRSHRQPVKPSSRPAD